MQDESKSVSTLTLPSLQCLPNYVKEVQLISSVYPVCLSMSFARLGAACTVHQRWKVL